MRFDSSVALKPGFVLVVWAGNEQRSVRLDRLGAQHLASLLRVQAGVEVAKKGRGNVVGAELVAGLKTKPAGPVRLNSSRKGAIRL
jgi:hypothetical protein